MACTRPITAWRSKYGRSKNGSWPIVFNVKEGFIDMEVKIPCGKCIECKLEKSRQWAARCELEAQSHQQKMFITLTFNNKKLPKNGSIDLKHVQKFIKRLRKHIDKKEDKKIKFLACGEYGKKLSRPHYHVLIFGYEFPDLEPLQINYLKKQSVSRFSNKAGKSKLYRSETLEKLWTYGFSTIGELTYDSAAYVARYITKKITGELADDHYKGKKPEFITMSNGIGKDWINKYNRDVMSTDRVIIKNHLTVKVPRYYDNIIQNIEGEQKFRKRKAERRKKIEELDIDELAYRDNVNIKKQQRQERKMENVNTMFN